jgi:putative ABC transport system permease protein
LEREGQSACKKSDEAMTTTDQQQHPVMGGGEGLIPVSIPILLAAMVPLLGIALASFLLHLNIERAVLVGTVRSAVQLTICGTILEPIFRYGTRPSFYDLGWLLVLLYLLFMVLLAAWETSRRPKFYFDRMFLYILLSFMINVGWVSIFAFVILLQTKPMWDPKYVIPMSGMLLGNCVNGAALSLSHILVSLKEQTASIELLLSFGATTREATADIVRESVRTGSLPALNGMMVIGLISIPGMMTGQMLGGSPVMEAARYQILITYLIAVCAFGTILTVVSIAQHVGCDAQYQCLQTQRFLPRSAQPKRSFSPVDCIVDAARSVASLFGFVTKPPATPAANAESTKMLLSSKTDNNVNDFYGAVEAGSGGDTSNGSNGRSKIQLSKMRSGIVDEMQNDGVPLLEVQDVERVINDATVLFSGITAALFPGDVVCVSGASGAGKSSLLRLIVGLDRHDRGTIQLRGRSRPTHSGMADFRRQVRYVTQYKVAVPGTPRQFIDRIVGLESWKKKQQVDPVGDNDNSTPPPTGDEMIESTASYLKSWGMDSRKFLDEEWWMLSGGEGQRVLVAICLASKPSVLLFDESTSSLDGATKQQVENSVLDAARSMAVFWISHDQDQILRMSDKN